MSTVTTAKNKSATPDFFPELCTTSHQKLRTFASSDISVWREALNLASQNEKLLGHLKETRPLLTLTQDQETALHWMEALALGKNQTPKVLVVNGYAGTGKTTLLAPFAKWCASIHQPAILLAFTNSAVKNVRDRSEGFLTLNNCRTIHSVLYGPPKNGAFPIGKPHDIKGASVIILDEASLVPSEVMLDLLKVVERQKLKLLIVGDSFQLGAVESRHEVASGFHPLLKPHMTLSEVVRQKALSEVLNIATKTRCANHIVLPGSRLEAHEIPKAADGAWKYQLEKGRTIELYSDLWREHPGNVVILVGNNKDRVRLNISIRPNLIEGSNSALVVTDPLIALANTNGVANGSIINAPTIDAQTKVNMHNLKRFDPSFGVGKMVDEKVILYEFGLGQNEETRAIALFPETLAPSLPYFSMIATLPNEMKARFAKAIPVTYAYALTAHKAQGMEWQDVITIPDTNSATFRANSLDMSHWYYTAATRAKNRLFVGVGKDSI